MTVRNGIAALVASVSLLCCSQREASGPSPSDAAQETMIPDSGRPDAGSSSSTDAGSTDAGASDAGSNQAGPTEMVTVFQGAHMTGSNRQTDTTVTLPQGLFSSITLSWTLSCPPAGCDPWDRIAELHVVQPGADGGEQTIEVVRLITPYGVGSTWTYDVTDLAPILTGPQTFRLFVDTWVDGWMADISLSYVGGVPMLVPTSVENLWRNGDAVYGDPSNPIDAQFPALSETRAAGESDSIRTIVTGHGQGNLDNCSEFCPVTHTINVGSRALMLSLWRTDCAQNPVSNQAGTWQYDRAGWCPGASVVPVVFDVTAALAEGASTPVSIAFQDYTNTCRPDAGASCGGCTAGPDCNYNSNGHTEPFYDTSVELIRYRSP
jgi:hypothetical protein